ncbi:hypothetical protein [Pseudomonas fluorescens]|uniref:hypothetical protein n=1 Tax=Pseudomonas fluorescens TaxID=294 RepID=UPI003D082D3C
MKPSIHALSAVFAISLVGCGGNVKTIEAFQKSTDSLTGDYVKLADKIDEMCIEDALKTQLLSPQYNGPNETHVLNVVEQTCGGAKAAKKQLRNAAVVLDSYVTALAQVAGLDVKVFDDDLKSLSEAVDGLKTRNDNRVFKESEVSAAQSLAKFVSQEMTSYLVKKEVSGAIKKNRDSFNNLVNAIALHIKTALPSQADANYATNSELAQALYETGNADGLLIGERLPARTAADIYNERAEASKKAKEAANKFDVAAKQLVKANDDLAVKYETLSKEEQLDSLKSLVKRAAEVRDAVRAVK